ncbi:hypothetical protein FRC04_007186 [Tulasnella sp. 424]|nr:hypothetical protein FRC04_007186 [Tulasnella sp. 424]KAG8974622.1 hypothetical protein FRC05_007098 [Tulasnella sp. 425]
MGCWCSRQDKPPPGHGNQTTPGPPVNENPTLPASSMSEAQPQPPPRRGKPAPPDAPVDPNPTRRGNPITPDAPLDQNPTHPTSSQPEAPGAQAPNTFRWSGFKNVEHLFIEPRRLEIKEGSQVGAGGFGEVMLATLHLARELRIWATLQHPNILGLLGYYSSENYEIAQLISVYMVNGNVSQYLSKNQPDIATRLKFVQGITSGLQYLHEFNPPVCHGDLKPANVLISDELDAVICDFGVASLIDQEAGPSGLTTSRTVKGSLRYMSPELLLKEGGQHTLPSDIWAWACTTYEIFTDIEPYGETKTIGPMSVEMHLGKAPGSIQVLLSRLTGDEKWPITLSEVINDCWNFDSSKRPTVAMLIGATKYPISRNSVNPPSSSPVGVTHGDPSAHVQSIKDGADSGYNSGQVPTRDNARHLDRSTRDNDRGDSGHQPEGFRNGASVDQNPVSSQSEAQAHWPPTRRGNQTTPGAPVNQHPTHPTSPQPEAPGTQAPNMVRSEPPTRYGNPTPSAPVDPNPTNPTSSQPEAPGAQAPKTFRSELPTHRGNPTPGAPVDSNPTNPTSSKSEVQAQPPTRRGNPTTLGAPVDQNPTDPLSSQPEAPGAQALNTFRSKPSTRHGNPTPSTPVDPNPTHPTSSQPEAPNAQAPNTFRSEPFTRRGNPTPGAPVDSNPSNPTSPKSEVEAQPLTRRGNPTTLGAPVNQNPTYPTLSQPEAPGAQAPNTFQSEPPTHRGNPTPGAPVDSNPTNPTSSKSEVQAQPPTRRGNPTTLGAPVDQDPTHPTLSQLAAPGAQAPNTFRSKTPIRRGNSSTPDAPVGQNPTRAHPASSQPKALDAQAPNSFRSEPPTRRGNLTPGAPVDQNPTHPTSSQPEAPGAQAPNTFRPEPPTRRGSPNTLDAPVDQNPTHSTSSQPEAPGNQGQNTFRSKPPTRRGNPTTPSAPVDQNPTHPTSSRPEAPVSVTQENSSSNLQTLGINNGAESRLNSEPDPTGDIPAGLRRYLDPNEKDRGRRDSTHQGPTHGTPINQHYVNPPSSRSEAPVGITQGDSSANIQSAKNGLDSGSNSRLAPALARYLDRIEKENSRDPTLPYSEAPVGVTERSTVIYADFGFNSALGLGGDISNGGSRSHH